MSSVSTIFFSFSLAQINKPDDEELIFNSLVAAETNSAGEHVAIHQHQGPSLKEQVSVNTVQRPSQEKSNILI